jgi:hypothetical protein
MSPYLSTLPFYATVGLFRVIWTNGRTCPIAVGATMCPSAVKRRDHGMLTVVV